MYDIGRAGRSERRAAAATAPAAGVERPRPHRRPRRSPRRRRHHPPLGCTATVPPPATPAAPLCGVRRPLQAARAPVAGEPPPPPPPPARAGPDRGETPAASPVRADPWVLPVPPPPPPAITSGVAPSSTLEAPPPPPPPSPVLPPPPLKPPAVVTRITLWALAPDTHREHAPGARRRPRPTARPGSPRSVAAEPGPPSPVGLNRDADDASRHGKGLDCR